MRDLEAQLGDLASHLDVTADPALPARVVARLDASGGPSPLSRTRRRRALVAAAVSGILLGGAIGGPAVADWISTRVGGIDVRRETPPPNVSRSLLSGVDLGERTSLAREGVDAPSALGAPREVWVGDVGGVRVVSLLYAPARGLPATRGGVGALVQIFEAPLEAGAVMTKFAGPGTVVEAVAVNGAPGLWIGSDHPIVVRHRGDLVPVEPRLAAHTLAWAVDGVTYRLESNLDLDASRRIAESFS